MPPKKVSLKQRETQRIFDTIARAVAQHRLKPGQRLIEAQIVDSLKANRNHVQVALQRLALQKIISIEPNRGAMVAKPTAEEAKEVFTVRRCIERGIVESITPDIIAANRDRIDEHMKKERAATQGNDRREIVAALSEFHKLLGDICGNALFQSILETLMVRSTLIVSLYQRNDIPSCASDEHQQVIEALTRGDTAAAVQTMDEHLSELEEQLVLKDPEVEELNISDALKGL